MAKINEHFLKLRAGYLFPEIARRVNAFCESHPDANVIKMGIGDVTQPLPPAIIEAMHSAVDEMARPESFRGYGPEQGYAFLREAIVENDFKPRGVDIKPDEIFISDGSKCDSGNLLDIFGDDNGSRRLTGGSPAVAIGGYRPPLMVLISAVGRVLQ